MKKFSTILSIILLAVTSCKKDEPETKIETVTKTEKVVTTCRETEAQVYDKNGALLNVIRTYYTGFIPDSVKHFNGNTVVAIYKYESLGSLSRKAIELNPTTRQPVNSTNYTVYTYNEYGHVTMKKTYVNSVSTGFISMQYNCN
jgi:hypothetical protein